MPTILLEQIIELLTGWKDSFFTWANAIGDKIASIKTNTDSLPDIKDNTDDIKDNTAAVITPISNINTNVSSISSDTASIRTDTGIIKNNAQAIATSSGQAAAFAEDVANNTLEVKNKVVTIASDTTQMRADSGSIRADVSEIKNTLGLYLYNTFVTEDSDGPIALCDTDLEEYLLKSVVTIPADAGGISEAKVGYIDMNQYASRRTAAASGITSTIDSDEVLTLSGVITASYANITNNISIVTDHVYFLILNIIENPNNIPFRMGLFNGTYSGNTMSSIVKGNNYTILKANTTINSGTGISGLTVNTDLTGIKLRLCYIDITKAFNSDIASKLFSLPDNGLSYIKSIFTKDYYPTNAGGTMVSVESVNGSYYPNASVSFGSSITDGGSLDLTTGLLTVNTTPQTLIQLAPAPIKTLKGLNAIWADCGNMDVTYRETLKHYLEKQDNNSRSLNRNVNLLRENTESLDLSDEDSNRRI